MALLSAQAGCAYSSYQSARMLPRGGTELAAAVTQYGFQGEGGADEEAFEVMATHGVSDQLELGGKVTWFTIDNADTFDFLFVPKYSLIPDTLAVTVPAGLILVTGDSSNDNAWLLMPGLLYSRVLNEYFELHLAGKPVVEFSDNFDDYQISAAANIGIRLTPPGQRWALHPEVGIFWDEDFGSDGNPDYGLAIGFAFVYLLGPDRATAPAPAP